MYEVFKQLAGIVKPMVQNEFQQAKDLEVVRANYGDNSITNTPQGVKGSQYQAGVVNQIHMIIASVGRQHVELIPIQLAHATPYS